jgi:prepilin-type N-terminal cleavage/methylation domain-containing protein
MHFSKVTCQTSRFAGASARRANVKRQKGFTLIELLLYIFILAVVSVIIANVFIVFGRSRGQVEAKAEVNSNLRFAAALIKQDVLSASALVTPATAGTASTTLELTVSGAAIKYQLDSGQLTRKRGAAAPERIGADSVSFETLKFLRTENTNSVLNKKMIGVEIELKARLSRPDPDWQYDQTVKTAVELRTDI